MKLEWNKRFTQGTVVALSFMAITAGTVVDHKVNAHTPEVTVTAMRTAGIVSALNAMEGSALSAANVETANVTVVARGTEVSEAQHPEWENRLMAQVEESLNVRSEANTDSDIVGKMYQGDVAEVIGTVDGWYQITSGNVTGYVSADYCVTGDDAYELASQVCGVYATATEGGIRIRSEANADSSILSALAQGESIEVDTQADEMEGWVAVQYAGMTGYVSSAYVEVAMDMGTAITIEEEQAILEAIRAQEAAEAAAAQAAAQAKAVQVTQNAAIAASYDDVTLLAALIQCEAGNECYEGKLAVGAVVVNRVRSGGYPGSVYGVIYQSSQFTPAASGSVAAVAAAGPSSSCIQAAQEALSGVDNTGGCMSFRPVSSGRSGVVIGNQVFF
jgi:uncharacterized protein YgiM (DUF1202 family)